MLVKLERKSTLHLNKKKKYMSSNIPFVIHLMT